MKKPAVFVFFKYGGVATGGGLSLFEENTPNIDKHGLDSPEIVEPLVVYHKTKMVLPKLTKVNSGSGCKRFK